MAVNVTNDTTNQVGRYFYRMGKATGSNGLAVFLNISSDLNTTVGNTTYTATKITRVVMVTLGDEGEWLLRFDADSDTNLAILKGTFGADLDVDFRSNHQGGLVDPKTTGYTGDIMIQEATASGSLEVWVYIEGELIP